MSVSQTGDIEGAKKYGRLSMLLSALAMLLGVAVFIFIGFSLGMEGRHEANAVFSAVPLALLSLLSFSQRSRSDPWDEKSLL